MRKVFSFALVALLGGVLATGCSDDNDSKDTSSDGKPDLVLAVDMQPKATMGYLVPLKDLSVGSASFTNAHEVKSNPYEYSYKDWVFYVPGTSDGTIIKYTRMDDGTLRQDGKLLVGKATPFCGSIVVASDTKAYASATLDNKIIIFNPSTMQETGEINLADKKWGLDGSSTPNPIGLIIRDGKLFVGCGQFERMPISKSGAHMLVIDVATDTPKKMFSDTRLSSASIFDCGMFIDEKGDLYVTCWGSYGYVEGQKFGLLRVKKGATEFDPGYCFNMSDMNIEGVQGGKLQYSITNYYAGNGELYVLGYCPAFIGSGGPNYYNDKTNYSLKADLYNCTMKTLDLPRTNGYSCAINKKGDDILFGLTTESNGAGIFTYNRKTGICSSAPIVKVQGTITDILVFDDNK